MMNEQPHILVVDDDERLRRLLKKFLSENGFNVSIAQDAQDARNKLGLLEFDLIVLDLMMPGESGLDFARDFRSSNDTPILMLTAMSEGEDRIFGLECGAEDYLTKPFEPRELVLRINNILKRVVRSTPQDQTDLIQLGGLVFDSQRHILSRNGKQIHLTASEASLLVILAENENKVLSREQLAELSGIAGNDRTIDVQVTRLRRKIEIDPKMPRYLQTVRGQGYVLRPS
ncbi:DNA-binding response regulator [Terasakiella brassicae]|uniref:DNA-binding response regulator n=1 Tax=Terasakiella brassicae TaxID=1634917 RepID=A0A917C0I8_9PROT|nr:response regulator transcription factor [Terasakiella brassicae]GGF66413.1 DNA-binding response regulator [Terasakiella brassicae]